MKLSKQIFPKKVSSARYVTMLHEVLVFGIDTFLQVHQPSIGPDTDTCIGLSIIQTCSAMSVNSEQTIQKNDNIYILFTLSILYGNENHDVEFHSYTRAPSIKMLPFTVV